MTSRTLVWAWVIAFGGVSAAAAQGYPARPITLVNPFAAGGPVDAVARIMSAPMSKILGQPVLVDYTVGAAGTLGVGRVARAAPDGYTLSIGHWATHVINAAIYPLQYDVLRDLEPVGMICANPLMIVARGSFPAKDLSELIAWLKANPDKASVGTAGVGSGSHMGGVYFQSATGTKIQYIPYKGTGPAMQDLLAGRLDFMVDQASNSLPQVRAGKIKAYAVTAKTRLSAAPEIPTVDEAGLPGLYVSVWFAIWAPKGTPHGVVAKLNAAMQSSLADPSVRQRLADLGQEITPREQQSPEALAAFHKAETEKWWPLVRAAGIKPE
jgi:tripartite-type tricarboxylate transporter receptor subunit TctC